MFGLKFSFLNHVIVSLLRRRGFIEEERFLDLLRSITVYWRCFSWQIIHYCSTVAALPLSSTLSLPLLQSPYLSRIMSELLNRTCEKTKTLTTPEFGSDMRSAEICLGITNCILFGFGTMIGGFMTADFPDILIGLLQLFVPFVGWLWSILWGIIMIVGKNST
jgi:hypothetical protein